MYRIVLLIALAVFTASCKSSRNESESSRSEKMEDVVAATVEELVASPGDYAGRKVAISGMVTHVCRHGGQKCFVLGEDGETQIRVVPSGNIDEFQIGLEGSTVAFKGTFRMMSAAEAEEHVADHDSKEHHDTEMAHTEAEKADIFIEAIAFRETTP